MSELTPEQAVWRGRFEGLIGLAAPALDLLLTVGERISRVAEPEDHEYYPVRSGSETRLPGEFERAPVSERSTGD